jgi:hypothetical protein
VDAEQTYDVSFALESGDEDTHVDGEEHAHADEEEHMHADEEEHAHADEEDHDHAAETTTGADDEITEVTGCHAHTDTIYCMVGSEEWEVTTEIDVENAPDGFTGCHAHGEGNLYALGSTHSLSQFHVLTSTDTVPKVTSKSVSRVLAPPLKTTVTRVLHPPLLRAQLARRLIVIPMQVSSKQRDLMTLDKADDC